LQSLVPFIVRRKRCFSGDDSEQSRQLDPAVVFAFLNVVPH
jgi:hypothetical protein